MVELHSKSRIRKMEGAIFHDFLSLGSPKEMWETSVAAS